MFEICPVFVETKYSKILTIDRVLAIVGTGHGALKYLPDEPATHVT